MAEFETTPSAMMESPLSDHRSQPRRTARPRPESYSSTYSFDSQRRRSSNSDHHRLSISSGASHDLSPGIDHRSRIVSGAGTLADELDSAEEDEEDWVEERGDEDAIKAVPDKHVSMNDHSDATLQQVDDDGANAASRDSGVDITDMSGSDAFKSARLVTLPSRLSGEQDMDSTTDDEFSRELELAIHDIEDLATGANASPVDTTHRTMTALRELSNLQQLDTLVHRLTTSINSLASQMLTHTKTLQTASTFLFPPFLSFYNPVATLSPDAIEELLDLHYDLAKAIPQSDPLVLQQLRKLHRDTADLQHALSTLLDSIQLGKQISTSAARSLKVALSMVAELRREHDGAEKGRLYISTGRWEERLGQRWCAGQCRDVVSGFEAVCDELRARFQSAAVFAS